MSEEVFRKISVNINANTLRRYFGLIKSVTRPSFTTLDILSRFCSFSSFDEFVNRKTTVFKIGDVDYYSDSILNYLISLFKNTPVKQNDRGFISIVSFTIQLLQRHPELIDKFQREISKTKNGQEFYFEKFIQIDALNFSYGDGLRYYLMEKKTIEAQIFGHSLLCVKSWLVEDDAGVKKHHNEIYKCPIPKNMHPSIVAHFYVVQLLFATINRTSTEKILAKILQAHVAIKVKAVDYQSFPFFEYIISPVLLLIGQPADAVYYINHAFSDYSRNSTGIKATFFHTMDIIKTVAMLKMGKKKEAKNLYKAIRSENYNLLTKNADMLLYLFLGKSLNADNNTPGDQKEIKALIAKTGFTRLVTYLEILN